MRYDLFKRLLEHYTDITANVKIVSEYDNSWVDETDEIPDNIIDNIEQVIYFLQSKIEEGYICKKNEFLMIYDFELLMSNNNDLFALNTVIKPIEQINDLNSCRGTSLQLVANCLTGEIGNSSYGLSQMGISAEEEGEEKSLIYGNYKCSLFGTNYFKNVYNFLFEEKTTNPPLCFNYQQRCSSFLKTSMDFVTSFAPENNLSFGKHLYTLMKAPQC